MRILLAFLIICINYNDLSAEMRIVASTPQIKVAVIDTGLETKYMDQVPLCESGHKDFTKEGLTDTHGHGTNVVGLIVKNSNISGYCVVLIKAYGFKNKTEVQYMREAIEYADKIGANVLNISGGGLGFSKLEYEAIKRLLDRGATIVAAAGNESLDLDKECNYYPACYDKRIYVVGSMSEDSNHGKIVDIKIDGAKKTAFGKTFSGTSQSTAQFTGLMLNIALSKKKK